MKITRRLYPVFILSFFDITNEGANFPEKPEDGMHKCMLCFKQE